VASHLVLQAQTILSWGRQRAEENERTERGGMKEASMAAASGVGRRGGEDKEGKKKKKHLLEKHSYISNMLQHIPPLWPL